jgi:hypothetical protein
MVKVVINYNSVLAVYSETTIKFNKYPNTTLPNLTSDIFSEDFDSKYTLKVKSSAPAGVVSAVKQIIIFTLDSRLQLYFVTKIYSTSDILPS